jgi:hypothetical protein
MFLMANIIRSPSRSVAPVYELPAAAVTEVVYVLVMNVWPVPKSDGVMLPTFEMGVQPQVDQPASCLCRLKLKLVKLGVLETVTE